MLLPRDALSVPVVRRVLRSSMVTLGVDQTCISDIEVALTEACTNVLDHALAGDAYHVVARLNDQICVIDVVDSGHGFDAERHGRAAADLAAEAGRGIQLIRALVDSVRFSPGDVSGTVVHFEKALVALPDSPLRRLGELRAAGATPGEIRDAEVRVAERSDALSAAEAAALQP